jgi:hypothetical protein
LGLGLNFESGLWLGLELLVFELGLGLLVLGLLGLGLLVLELGLGLGPGLLGLVLLELELGLGLGLGHGWQLPPQSKPVSSPFNSPSVQLGTYPTKVEVWVMVTLNAPGTRRVTVPP